MSFFEPFGYVRAIPAVFGNVFEAVVCVNVAMVGSNVVEDEAVEWGTEGFARL